MKLPIRKFMNDPNGATAIEYALIASLVSIAIIGALLWFQGGMNDVFQYIASNIDPALRGQD